MPTIAAGVLAQAWRGGPQAQLSRLLAGCQIEELDELRARSAGAACAAAGTSDVVDASVVVGAVSRGDRIVTGDSQDLQQLIDALRVDVALIEL